MYLCNILVTKISSVIVCVISFSLLTKNFYKHDLSFVIYNALKGLHQLIHLNCCQYQHLFPSSFTIQNKCLHQHPAYCIWSRSKSHVWPHDFMYALLFFCRGPDNEYFGLSESRGLSCNYLWSLEHKSYQIQCIRDTARFGCYRTGFGPQK